MHPVTEQILDLATGARVAVFQAGQGPDLVYLPGSNVDYRLRRGVFESPLPERFRVTTLEHRGLARSVGPEGPWQMQDFAGDVLELMRSLSLKRAYLLGESFGAMVAQWVALADPERFIRVAVACGSAGGRMGSSFPFHELVQSTPWERARQVLLHINSKNVEIEREAPDKFEAMVLGRIDFERRFLANLAQPDGYERLLMARSGHDCSEFLTTLSLPVEIMAGTDDGIAPLVNQQRMASLLSNVTFQEFSGGHDFLWSTTPPVDWLLRAWAW